MLNQLVTDLCRGAIKLHQSGQTLRAIDVLRERVNESPDEGRVWELLGMLAYAVNNFKLATESLEHASALLPLSPRAQVVLAKCYDESGHRSAARTIYTHVASLDNLADDLYEPLSAGLGRHGEYQQALTVCRLAARRMPDNPEPLKGIVHYMRRLRMPVERILPTLFRAHHLAPEDQDCRITLAWLLHETGQSDEGVYLLEQVECEEFTCIRCLTLMQHIFEAVGKNDRAGDCRHRLKVLAGEWPGSGE